MTNEGPGKNMKLRASRSELDETMCMAGQQGHLRVATGLGNVPRVSELIVQRVQLLPGDTSGLPDGS